MILEMLFAVNARAEVTIMPAALADLTQGLKKSKEQLEAEEAKRRQVLSALYQVNQRIHKTVSEKSKMLGELNGVQDNVQRLGAQLEQLDGTAAKLKSQLAERLRVLQHMGGPSIARILLSASSSSQLDRNLKILGLIAARDRDLLETYRRVREEIDLKKNRLGQRLARLKKVEGSLKDREQRLVSEQDLKNRLLKGIRKKRLFALQSLQELKERTRQYEGVDDALVDTLVRPSFEEQKGRLVPPVAGVVSRRFGPEKAGDDSWIINQKSVRIGAPVGQAVRAVFDGMVAWIGDIPGLGRSLILDHGDHYYSVYAETQDLKVHAGDEVRRDQVLASVGRAPLQKYPGLHFEIRHFSEPEDPQAWMKGTPL